MHIAIDARIINSSTGRYIERLLTHLEQLDSPHQFTVLVRKKDKDYWTPTKPNFTVKVANFSNYSFAEQIGFYFYLKRLKPDLVHFCMPQQPLLYRGMSVTSILDLNLLRITSNKMKRFELKVKQKIFGFLLKRVARRSARILTISKYSKDDIIEYTGVEPGCIRVAYPAAEKLSMAPKVVAELKGKQFILYVGRAESYKNNRGLVRAHQMLLKKYPRLQLIVVGKIDKQRQADIDWVNEHEYINVEFMGFVPDDQLAWLYKNCAVYVFPSHMEGFGLPPLEAMLYGAPVASSNATCLPEVLGDAALYFDPADSQEMAQKIHTILNNPKLRKELVARGYEQVKKYSWEKMARQTLAIYNEIL